MPFTYEALLTPGTTYIAYIEQVGDDNTPGAIWDNTNSIWGSNTFPLAANVHEIAVTQMHASNAEKSRFTLTTNANLGTYTGRINIHFIDTTLGVVEVVRTDVVYISQGLAAREPVSYQGADVLEGHVNGVEQTVRVRCTKYIDNTRPATGSVVSTTIRYPGGTPVSTTNAAAYTGTPGVYKVLLTATEADVEADLKDELQIDITTSDGSGRAYLEFSRNPIDADWANGGRLDLILDSINTRTTNLDTSVSILVYPAIQALPTAAAIADAVWDEAISGHVTAGSAGERVERLDILASGGAGEITTTRASNLDNLDEAVSTAATPSEVATQCLASMVSLHLDHLLAAAYDPASKPGVSNSLWNTIIESDAGVPRFTANSLETAPTGGGASATAIADAVWDEARAGHTTAGTFGESLATSLPAVLADTDFIQTTLDTGGTIQTAIAACSTSSQVSALNNLSAANVASELATFYTGTLDARFDSIDTAVAGVITTGNSAWVTATGTGLSLTAAGIRSEIDANSTQLAAIVADTNELQTDWANGGRLDLILDTASTVDAAAVRTEMDNNSTKLAAILADTAELQSDWVNGGRLDEILDAVASDSIEPIITAIKTSLDPGGTTHTQIAAISPNPTSLSPEFISDNRTWIAPQEGLEAVNRITLGLNDQATLAMDFEGVLNPDTGIGTASAPTLYSGDADLTFGTAQVSQRHTQVHVKVSGQQSGKTYKIRFQCTTTDNDIISAIGTLVCK